METGGEVDAAVEEETALVGGGLWRTSRGFGLVCDLRWKLFGSQGR